MAGYFMYQHIERVEREEGKEFAAVLALLANSGESKSSVAELLGIPQTTFCAWLRQTKDKYILAISWPVKGQSNGFRGNVETNTPARKAARLRNISLTRTHKTL